MEPCFIIEEIVFKLHCLLYILNDYNVKDNEIVRDGAEAITGAVSKLPSITDFDMHCFIVWLIMIKCERQHC